MSLQSDLNKRLNVKPKIKWGSPGSLDVFVDGKKIYSYQETHRLPTADDIVQAMEKSSA